MTDQPLSGVFAPVLTPFTPSLDVDAKSHLNFCRWLLQNDVGLAVFGTNSEANSLSVAERVAQLEYLSANGIPGDRLLPGTGTCALPDTVELTKAALRCKAAAVLMLPPFFYKPVTDDGLFASFAEVIERVGGAKLRVCLYHIPRLSGVGFSLAVIGRLLARYPKTVVGLKDSGGDMAYTLSLLKEFPQFRTFCGSEAFLTETMRNGGAGCISAGANVNPAAIAAACRTWREAGADARQTALNGVRGTLEKRPMIAALKAAVAHFGKQPDFARTRPPLEALSSEQTASLLADLSASGFAMPGLERQLAG